MYAHKESNQKGKVIIKKTVLNWPYPKELPEDTF